MNDPNWNSSLLMGGFAYLMTMATKGTRKMTQPTLQRLVQRSVRRGKLQHTDDVWTEVSVTFVQIDSGTKLLLAEWQWKCVVGYGSRERNEAAEPLGQKQLTFERIDGDPDDPSTVAAALQLFKESDRALATWMDDSAEDAIKEYLDRKAEEKKKKETEAKETEAKETEAKETQEKA